MLAELTKVKNGVKGKSIASITTAVDWERLIIICLGPIEAH